MSMMWFVTAFLSAILLALSNVTMRLGYNRHGSFWEAFYSKYPTNLLLALPLLIAGFQIYDYPSLKEVGVALVYGLLAGTFSTIMFSYSIKECGSVVTGSASLSVEPATAMLLGAVVVGERVSVWAIIAILLFPVVAYFLYKGSREHSSANSCGSKIFIGSFTGAWASVMGVAYSYLAKIGLATNPVLFYYTSILAGAVAFLYPAVKNGFSFQTLFEVPKVIYLSAFLAILGIVMKMVSLTYGVPGHSIAIILLYPVFTVVFSWALPETDEPVNRYTVRAVLLATFSAFLVTFSQA